MIRMIVWVWRCVCFVETWHEVLGMRLARFRCGFDIGVFDILLAREVGGCILFGEAF